MFNLFKCSHPADRLVVEKDQTVTPHDEDFEHIDYHFICMKCNKPVTIGYAKMIGGVEAYMERGRKKYG